MSTKLRNLEGRVETSGGRRRFRPKKRDRFKVHGQEKPQSTGAGPAPMIIAEYAQRARYVKPFMEHFHARFKGKTEALKLVEDLIEKIKNDAKPELNVTLTNPGNMKHKVIMFFTLERDKYILIEQDFVLDCIRRSRAYLTRARCLADYNNKRVQWTETIHFREIILSPS